MNRAPRILIVDDEDQNLVFYEQALRLENFAIVTARDGLEALDKFEKFQPDLVLCDLMMPRLNGYEFCARLRHKSTGRHVPIILLSALDESEVKPLALENDANLFLSKPVDPATLTASIQALLRLGQPA